MLSPGFSRRARVCTRLPAFLKRSLELHRHDAPRGSHSQGSLASVPFCGLVRAVGENPKLWRGHARTAGSQGLTEAPLNLETARTCARRELSSAARHAIFRQADIFRGPMGQTPRTVTSRTPLEGHIKVLFCGDEFPAAYDCSVEHIHKEPNIKAVWCHRPEVPEQVKDCHVMVPRMTKITEDILSQAQNLKLIVQFGVGLEGVDIPAATARNIMVARIPSTSTGNAASCAEHCIYLLLGLLRQQAEMDVSVKNQKLGQPLGRTLQGKTVLISGYGAIGRELAVRLWPFGVRTIGIRRSWNGQQPLLAQEAPPVPPVSSPQGMEAGIGSEVPYPLHVAAGMDSAPELLPQADAVVMCNHLSDDTRGMVNSDFLSFCKEGVLLVNIARGGLLDYTSVESSLSSGKIGGLGLDVTWHEPVDPDDPIFSYPNVIVTPHVGGVTDVSYKTMGKIISDTVIHLRDGRPLGLVEVVNEDLIASW